MERELGRRIRKLRLAKHLTQQALAEKAGVNDKHIGVIERTGKDLAFSTIVRIAAALEVSVAELFPQPDSDDREVVELLVRKVLADDSSEAVRKLRVFLESILLR